MVERLPVGVLIFSRTRLELVYANAAARALVRPTRLRTNQELPEPWPNFSLREYAWRLVSHGFGAHERVDLDGDRVYLVSGLSARGTSTSVILIEDVSQRERRSRAEREFVANAAHELLTPLTGIVSAAHVLEAGAKEVPAERDRFIGHIARECGRLATIARSLLVLARAQSGEEPPRLEIVRACDVLREAVASIGDGDLELQIECPDDIVVLADVDLLLQATRNLITNLVRHGSGDGLVLRAERVSSRILIDFVDDAAPEADVDAMRGRFRTGGGRDGGGFGLGLSIASQSLDVMDGRLLLSPEDRVIARIDLPWGGVVT